MTSIDRVALHQRLARGFWDGYAHAPDRKRVNYPDEWIFTEDAVAMSPSYSSGAEFPLGKFLAESGLSWSDVATIDMSMYWEHLPDLRIVTPLNCIAGEEGFAMWQRFAGTTADGRVLSFQETDIIRTDEDGRVCRWEFYFDTEFCRIVELVTGLPSPFTWDDYMTKLSSHVAATMGA